MMLLHVHVIARLYIYVTRLDFLGNQAVLIYFGDTQCSVETVVH